MGQTVIKLGRKLKGIKDHNVYRHQAFDKDIGNDVPEKSPGQIIDDARKIKRLEDRIHLLEIELQKAREESFKAGYDEGKQRTMQEALNRIEAVKLEMRRQEEHFRETLENLERPLLKLAKEMAREVIRIHMEEKDTADEVLKERLHLMLRQVVDQNNVWIEVNPDQLDVLHGETLKSNLNMKESAQVNITAGPGLKAGEAVINTEDYVVDGRFENHLDKLDAELTGEGRK